MVERSSPPDTMISKTDGSSIKKNRDVAELVTRRKRMIIHIGPFFITIRVEKDRPTPSPEEIDFLASHTYAHPSINVRVKHIKALRELGGKHRFGPMKGRPRWSLKDANEWVREHFEGDGDGPIKK
jgi:hypothetical protein